MNKIDPLGLQPKCDITIGELDDLLLTPRQRKVRRAIMTLVAALYGTPMPGSPGGVYVARTTFQIPGRVQSRINLKVGDGSKGSGLKYALGKHGGTGPGNKSQFSVSKSELKSLLQSKQVVSSKISISTTSGNYIRVVDIGKQVGNYPVNSGGAATSHITVITDKAGNLVNTFPGKPIF